MRNDTSMPEHIVIVGGGYAGLSCALRLARHSGARARITLINGSASFVERIRLHERAAGASAPALPLADMLHGSGVTLRVGWVQNIDLQRRTVAVGDDHVPWDRLVLALGSQVDVDRVPGVRELAYTLEEASALALSAELPALSAARAKVAVVGAGLTGIEAASELAEAYPQLSVVLVTRGEPAPGCSARARGQLRAGLTRLGVELREQAAVRALRPDMLLTDQGPIPVAACVWTTGFVASPIARSAGLATNEHGQVWVDPQLRSISHPGVHVAGDLAVLRDPRYASVPMGCKSALPTGVHVAENLANALAGRPARAFSYRAVPFLISLGRAAAVVELPALSAGARPLVLHGKLAAKLKELVCRGTRWALALERTRAAWAQSLRARATPRLTARADSSSGSPEISEQAGA